MNHLLLVEDDISLGKTLQERLIKEGYSVRLVTGQKEAYEEVLKNKFDLHILDLGLSDGSGFELAELIKGHCTAPFIFMTAASRAENRLKGFELGAEEFIPKPFHLKELLLRVKHVLENHSKKSEVKINNMIIDFDSMIIRNTLSGNESRLTNKESKILGLLIENSPKVISRDQILNDVWGEGEFPTNRTIDNAIVKLRQLLGEKAGKCIHSIRGVGYQWLVETVKKR